MAKRKYQPRKVKTKEIMRFRGLSDPDSKHNIPDEYVQQTTNLPSTKIGQMDTRTGELDIDAYDDGINTGDHFVISRVIAEGTNIHAEPLSKLNILPPQSRPPVLPPVQPPPLPPVPPLPPPFPGFNEDFIFKVQAPYSWFLQFAMELYPATDCTIDWGDGTSERVVYTTQDDAFITHSYPTHTIEYTITISGIFTGLVTDYIGAPNPYAAFIKEVVNIGNTALGVLSFYSCVNLTKFNGGDANTLPLGSIIRLFRDTGLDSADDVDFGTMSFESVAYAPEAFASMPNLPNLPNNWPTLIYSYGMFISSGIENITLKRLRFGQMRYSALMFASCFSLTEADITGWKNGSLLWASQMFSDCDNLVVFSAIGVDFSEMYEASYMFYSCTSLREFRIEDAQNPASFPVVLDVGRMFYNCGALTTAMNADLFWSNPTITSYYRCFYNCTNIANYGSIPADWKT